MSASGKFITLEGGEGAGKSTVLPRLEAALAAAGHEVVRTREPGGTPLAESIRAVLLGERDEAMPAMTELLLMFAARSAHLADRIRPALEAGQWVVSDRFTDASYAYQGAGRGLGEAVVERLETLVQGDLRPDLVLLFDLPPEIGLERTRGRDGNNRFDGEDIAFHRRVREAYLARAESSPSRYAVIDAARAPDEVFAQVQQALERLW